MSPPPMQSRPSDSSESSALNDPTPPSTTSSSFSDATRVNQYRHVSRKDTCIDDTNYHGPIIPDDNRKCRTLVMCFDGTGDQFDADNSNIVQLFSMLKKGDTERQMVYYQAGIGTYTIPQIATPLFASISKTIDLMIANNLNHHVMAGYAFLMENYKQGDKICIFGFSRGAYTARALAGMVHKVGLLPACNHQQVPFAYRMYMQDDEAGWKQSVLFKKTFSMDVDVEFVGVWDTVASVGLIARHLPFAKSNTSIRTFRHALSLDEHRVKFQPNFYQKLTPKEKERLGQPKGVDIKKAKKRAARKRMQSEQATRPSHHAKHGSSVIVEEVVDAVQKDVTKCVSNVERSVSSSSQDSEETFEAKYTNGKKQTDVLEVWFAGVHTDVGGGSVKNGTRHSLARISLRWMIRQIFEANIGIQFEADELWEVGLNPDTLWLPPDRRPPGWDVKKRPAALDVKTLSVEDVKHAEDGGLKIKKSDRGHKVMPSTGTANTLVNWTEDDEDNSDEADGHGRRVLTEEEEELWDCACPDYDQLRLNHGWWILEYMPLKQRVQASEGSWTDAVRLHCGRARVLENTQAREFKVHRSVKMRMEANGLNYTMRLKHEGVEPTWVD